MNEILLILLAIAFLVLPNLVLNSIKQPVKFYTKIVFATVLLLFAWLFQPEASLAVRIIITVVVVDGIYKAYRTYRRFGMDLARE